MAGGAWVREHERGLHQERMARHSSGSARHQDQTTQTPMPQNGVTKLKELLFEKESQEIGALTARIEEVVARAGSDQNFRRSVAATLEGALRDAETSNHRPIADALAPLVVRTVRAEVEASSDVLPAKLYPHIGVMVRDYVRSAIRDLMEDINRRLEDGLTRNRFMLRLRSWTTGRSMAELALAGTGRFEVDELHLIRRGSGELLAHWVRPTPDIATGPQANNRDALFSGLLTAMTAFIEEVYEADKAGLRTIDFGAHTIYLRGSPQHLLAARCRGEAGAGLQSLLDEEFLRTLQEEAASGAGSAPDLAALATRLEAGIATRQESDRNERGRAGMRPLRALLWLIALALAGFLGWHAYVGYRTHALQAAVDRVIAETPALKGYPARARVARGAERIEVSGLAPSGEIRADIIGRLREIAPDVAISEAIGIVPGAESAAVVDEVTRLRSQIATMQAQIDRLAGVSSRLDRLDELPARVDQLAAQLPRLNEVTTSVSGLAATVHGMAKSIEDKAASAAVESQLQDLRRQIAALAPRPDPQAELERWLRGHAIFFSEATTVRNQGEVDATLDTLAGLMRRADGAIRIIGYTDERGTNDRNLTLAQARADRIAADLARRGIDPARLIAIGRTAVLDISTRSGASSPNRRVTFEPAYVGEQP
jgi:outer membrane protein OmpA-like peptidoglycan-associated protein